MKRLLLIVIITTMLCSKGFGQVDTTITYFTKEDLISTKDSAYYFIKVYKNEDGWHREHYLLSNNLIVFHNF